MTTCYLCGCASHRQRPGSVRDDSRLRVLECDDCGLVVLSSMDHIAQSHYAASGMHGDQPPAVEAWLRAAEADDERRFRYFRYKLAGKRLLDFGCGAGGFLLKAREAAAVAEGVEPELRLQPHFDQSRLIVHVHLEDIAASGRSRFDLITAFHVVKHLPDPRTMLARLALLLVEGAELIVEVPSSDDALLTLFECEPYSRFTYWSQHLFLFNPRTLRELVRQAGLKLRWLEQVKRYPLSNHLYWLARGKPRGHLEGWRFIDSPALNEACSAQLAALGRCDTLLPGIVSA